MKTLTPLVAALAAAPLLASSTGLGERPTFAPADGTTLSKTFTMTMSMVMDEMSMLMNGNPLPMELDMQMDITSEQEFQIVDRYVAVAEGRPTRLQRTFRSLESGGTSRVDMGEMGSEESDSNATSALEGKAVVFTWDDGDYDVRWAEGHDGDAELLDGLTEDMDFRTLLPGREVSEGDTWTIAPNDLIPVLAPGGNLGFKADGMDSMGMGGMDMSLPEMIGELRGRASGEFMGVREIGGRRVAVMRLLVDVEGANDLTSKMQEMMADQEMPMGGTMVVEAADIELTLRGEGELHWDLAGNHFHAFEFKGEMTTAMDTAMSMSMMGDTMNMEQSMRFSADLVMKAQATRD